MAVSVANASEVVDLLRVRHSDCVFVEQCDAGGLWMDVWAMHKGWSNQVVYGYEVKVSRNDFLRDQKWHQYLDYCNEFYFACPSGLIDPSELPREAGLVWTSKNRTRLYTKKKAPRRTNPIPESVFRAILCNRATIHRHQPYDHEREEPRTQAQMWLDEQREDTAIGRKVARRIRQEVERRVGEVMEASDEVRQENQVLANAKEYLSTIGIDVDNESTWGIEHSIRKALDADTVDQIRKKASELLKLARSL
jgi:hypothetical protein